MSRFVLTAQLQLQAPNNVAQVVRQIQSQLNNVTVNVQVQGAAQAQRQLQQVTAQTQAATTAADRMGRAFAMSVRRFAAFSVATRVVSLFTSTLSDAINTAIDFEREMIKVSQVTGDSMAKLKGLTKTITDLATGFGVGSQSLLQASTLLLQAGISAKDTEVALKTLAKAALAPNFDSLSETTEGAIAILAQFGQGVGALEKQLGAINAVAGAFAVEAGDLIDVIRRAGGVFKSSGGELNELIALFTSVRATTRESAESIGTGLRTIFTRIQRPKTIEYLKQFGVELVDLNGKFVGPFEAVKRLSSALAGLGEGDITFIRIAEELGGFRQIGKVLPLLQQFTTAQNALNVANKAGNSLTSDAVTAQQALAIRITKVKEEFLALIRGITETKTFQVMANTALTLASALIKIGEAIKPLLPLLAAVAAVNFTRGIGSFIGSFARGMQSGRTFNKGGKVHHFARGGFVPGSGNGDTIPAMLQPGEFVIRKSSVKKLGASRLHAMNENRYATGGPVLASSLPSAAIKQRVKSANSKEAKENPNLFKSGYYLTDTDSIIFDKIEYGLKAAPDISPYKFEKLVAEKTKGRLIGGNAPVDVVGSNKGNLEVRNRIRTTKDKVLLDKFLRQRILENKPLIKNNIVGENLKFPDPVSVVYNTGKLSRDRFKKLSIGGLIQKFATGGLVNQDVVAGAILENVGFSNKDKITVKKQDIAAKLDKSLRLTDNYPIKAQKQYTLQKEGLSQSTFKNFRDIIDVNLATAAQNSAQSLGSDLGLAAKTAIPQNSLKTFLQGINDASVANLFEDTLKVLVGPPFSTDPRRAFDFSNGISNILKDDYKNITAQYVDAKSSIQSAGPSAFQTKIANQLASEAKELGFARVETVEENKSRKSAELKASISAGLAKKSQKKYFGGIIQKFARGGAVDTLERFYKGESLVGGAALTPENKKKLNPEQRKAAASELKDLRSLRSFAPEKLYTSISRVAFDSMASQIGFNKNPQVPSGSTLSIRDKENLIDQQAKRTVGKSFRLSGLLSTSKDYGVAKRFLDNAPRSQDRWAALLNIATKKNAQGVDVVQGLQGRKINATKQELNPRTGKMETYYMDPPESENEMILPPNSRFKINSSKFVETFANKNLWMDVQQFAAGGKMGNKEYWDKINANKPESAVDRILREYPAKDSTKKVDKDFGKISISEAGNMISAGYLQNNTRSGYVNAYKIRDNLYSVGLSQATKGYGPRLYDAVMEMVTSKGAMLTSDRSLVSGDARRIWEYYFRNRGDVKKTPLDPKDWTTNDSLIDPKLYGKKETWPPANDPAWVLQSGYSKSPSLINDPNSVIRGGRQQNSQSLALQFFQAKKGFATGGGVGTDTVPALLTPGEFVVNKKSAQQIGYGTLNRMNKVGKYAKGGVVDGVQRFFEGGKADKDAIRATGPIIGDLKQAISIVTDTLSQLGPEVQGILKGIKVEALRAGETVNTNAGRVSTDNLRGSARGTEGMRLNLHGKGKARATTDTVVHETGHLVDAALGKKTPAGKGMASTTKGTFQFDVVEKVKPVMIKAFEKAGMDAQQIEKYLASNKELFAEFFAKASPEVRAILASTTDSKVGMQRLAAHLKTAGSTYAGLEAADIDPSMAPVKKPSLMSRAAGAISSAYGAAKEKVTSVLTTTPPPPPKTLTRKDFETRTNNLADNKSIQREIATTAQEIKKTGEYAKRVSSSLDKQSKITDTLNKESVNLDAKIKGYDQALIKIAQQQGKAVATGKAASRIAQMKIEAETKKLEIDKKSLIAEQTLEGIKKKHADTLEKQNQLIQKQNSLIQQARSNKQSATQLTQQGLKGGKSSGNFAQGMREIEYARVRANKDKFTRGSVGGGMAPKDIGGAAMAISMVTASLQAMLPPLDENASAFTKLSHTLLSMVTTIAGVVFALQSFGINLKAQSTMQFLTGGGIGQGGLASMRGGLIDMGLSRGFSTQITNAANLFSKLLGPVALATAAFMGIQTVGYGLIDSIMNYDSRIKKAVETGNVEQARKLGAEQQNAKAQVNMGAGAVSGAILGGLLLPILGPLGPILGATIGATIAGALSDLPEYAGQVFATQAALAKSQEALKKASDDATKALTDFEKGNISVTQLLQSTAGATAAVAQSRAESEKLKKAGDANRDTAVTGGLRNLFTLGGLLGETTGQKDARITAEQDKSRKEVKKQEEEALRIAQPGMNALAKQVAMTGGSFDDLMKRIHDTDPNLYDILIRQGTKDLNDSFKNISKEVARTKAALEATNLGLRSAQATSTAMSASMARFASGLEVGGNTFVANTEFLSQAMTSAAQSMNPDDIKSAVSDVSKNLSAMGVSKAFTTKFEGNTNAFIQAQQNYGKAFDNIIAESKAMGKIFSADELKTKFADQLGNMMGPNVSEEAKKNLKAIIENIDLSPDEVNQIMSGNYQAFGDKLSEAGKKQFEEIMKIAQERQKAEQVIIDLTKQRIDAERNLVNAQKEAVDLFMEGREIQGKYGGKAVTTGERRSAILAKANIGAAGMGLGAMRTGSLAELRSRNNQIVTGFGAIEARRSVEGGMQGVGGVEAAGIQQNLQQAQKDQVQTIRDLIKLEEEELKLIQEKNRLEKESLDSLISGDIEKFFEQQAAAGAQAAIAAGDMNAANKFGGKAVGMAFQDIQRQKEAGVQSLFGMQLGGPGGLAEQAANAALSARGVIDPRMAQVMAGTTAEEEASKARLRDLGTALGETGAMGAAMAEMQVQTAQINVSNAQIKLSEIEQRGREAAARLSQGGVVYANNGIFVPRGTDTVPAMLTPGEFVVRREAVNRGNNLQLLRAINNGGNAGGFARGGKVGYYNDGGMVQYKALGDLIARAGQAIGIDPKVITNLGNVFTSFTNSFNESIKNLQQTKLQIKLDSVNVNVNLNGTSMLTQVSDETRKQIITEVVDTLKNQYGIGNNGKLQENTSRLPKLGG